MKILFPNLAEILRSHAKASAGPYYNEAKTEKAIEQVRARLDLFDELVGALNELNYAGSTGMTAMVAHAKARAVLDKAEPYQKI